jgi:DNA invertase Pin-like site-specific DNA recombinase
MKPTKQAAEGTALIYCRVSALESQNPSTLSLEAQETTLRAAATAAGCSDVRVIIERHTGSKRQPELEAALELLNSGQATALFAAKIDRLSRGGARDVLRIADNAAAAGWRLVVLDMGMDTGTLAGRLTLTILAGVAEMEAGRRTERMCEYHAARRTRGQQAGKDYGRKRIATPSTVTRVRAARAAGHTYAAIAAELAAEGAEGRTWSHNTVRRIALAA